MATATRTIVRYRNRPAVRRRRRRAAMMAIPVAPIAGFAIGMMPALQLAFAGQFSESLKSFAYRTTPYNPYTHRFDINGMLKGLGPVAGGVLAHKFIGQYLGVNRALSRAGVPLLRI